MARPRYEIAGRTAFVTGAARGIGAEAARRLHRRGANVALVGLEPERLEALASELGDRALAVEADVTDFGALEAAVAATVDRFGGVDVAIANAGISYMGSLAGMPMEQVERTFEVNLLGVWRTDRAVLEQIIARRGYLLNIASLAAVVHAPLMAPYSAAKAGVEAMTDSLRAELHHTGARAGTAYFGFIDTDLVRGGFESPASKVLRDSGPRRLSEPLPLSAAGDTIESAVERRAARAYAPRTVGPMIRWRGFVQTVVDRQAPRRRNFVSAMAQADREAVERAGRDQGMGVAVEAPRLRD